MSERRSYTIAPAWMIIISERIFEVERLTNSLDETLQELVDGEENVTIDSKVRSERLLERGLINFSVE